MTTPTMVIGIALLVASAKPTICAQTVKAQLAIALVGGTLIDVSSFGHSAHDIPNAVVVVRDSKIEAAASGIASEGVNPPQFPVTNYGRGRLACSMNSRCCTVNTISRGFPALLARAFPRL